MQHVTRNLYMTGNLLEQFAHFLGGEPKGTPE